MRKFKPELLSPAGGMESVKAAVQNGCSAVYVGASRFSARKNAENFTVNELEKAVDYCHARGVKLYVAANTLIKNNEIAVYMKLVESIYLIGADGVIVQDIGCASLIRKYFPDFYLSASTQMTVHDVNGVRFLSDKGFSRVVLARELSVKEISSICDGSQADIECFIHGAVCVCYSGQCLMSAFNGGRSGNRGDCAQPCRLNYKMYGKERLFAEGGLLSPKDLIGLYALPNLIDGGVKSFKIEGRMKSPEYVAGVTEVYRRYIDYYYESPENFRVDEKDVNRLAAIFNRSGFCKGYFYDYSGKHMMTDIKVGNTGVLIGRAETCENRSIKFKALCPLIPGDGVEVKGLKTGAYITKLYGAGDEAEIKLKNGNAAVGAELYRTYDKSLMDELRASYSGNKRKLEIKGRFEAKLGEPIVMSVSFDRIEAEIISIPAEKAQTAAATVESIKKQLMKTGNTPFVFSKLEIDIDGGLFISVAAINEIRREALLILENKIIKASKRVIGKTIQYPTVKALKGKKSIKKEITVLARTSEQLEALSEYSFSRLYVDFEADKGQTGIFRGKGIEVFKCLDRIERDCVSQNGFIGEYDGFLVRTYGQAENVKKYGFAIDYTLNVYNAFGAEFWAGEGCKSICVSPELNEFDYGAYIDTEAVCYGKITVMTTVQCPIGNFGEKGRKSGRFCEYRNKGNRIRHTLTNGKEYEMITVCGKCYCLVLESIPVSSKELCCKYNRVELSTENYVDTKKIMSIYKIL